MVNQTYHVRALGRGSMVKIAYESFKEVVIKEYVRFERIEDLTSIFAKVRAGGALVSPNLVKGLVFV